MAKTKAAKPANQEPIEKQLWKAADILQKSIDAAEYKHVVLGLIFLKYISDAFEELHASLQAGAGDMTGADPEDKDEYNAENVFFVPAEARWSRFDFGERFAELKAEFEGQIKEEAKLNKRILENLKRVEHEK